MKDVNFYHPETVSEVAQLFKTLPEGLEVVAGGTDLMVKWKKTQFPQHIVSISEIQEFVGIKEGIHSLNIGSLTSVTEIASSQAIIARCPLLAQAAATIGCIQTRNRATIGGNICNAAPSADLLPSLLVLDAKVKLIGPSGEKVVELEDFLIGPGQVALGNAELVKEIIVPIPPADAGGYYYKLKRRRGTDIALVGVAVLVEGFNYIVQEVRIALGAVSPIPFRVREAERLLAGKEYSIENLRRAANLTELAAKPISDVRASAAYRKEMVGVLTMEAIQNAWGKIRSL